MTGVQTCALPICFPVTIRGGCVDVARMMCSCSVELSEYVGGFDTTTKREEIQVIEGL